jgi:hypothetical protein
MKILNPLIAIFVVALCSYSFADIYVCSVHRTPGLKCGGYNYGEIIAPLEIETKYLSVGESLSNYSGAAVNLDINSPCEEFSGYNKIPMYLYQISKTSDNKLELTVIESVIDGGKIQSWIPHISSAPIGSKSITTPAFKDTLLGEVSVSYECKRSGTKL